LLILGVLLAGSPSRAAAQAAGAVLDSVRVEGNKLTDTALVRSTLSLKPGTALSPPAVREGLKRLWGLRLFSDLSVDGERSERGIVLTVRVVERPRITAVRFEGADKLSSDELLEKISSKVGTLLDRSTLDSDRRKLLAAYQEEGYARAQVAPLPKITGGTKADLTFRIEEDQKCKIREISFEGNEAFDGGKLRKAIKTKRKAFLRGGGFNQEKFQEDLERVAAFCRNHGYKDARVTDHALRYSPDGKDLRISITVEEGAKFTIGEIRFEGNTVLADSILVQTVRFESGSEYNQEQIDRASAEMYNLYMERGYLVSLSIQPDTEEHDHAVDVTYRIHEGDPSRIGEVKIVGNTRTKERVIRRELSVLPGQIFRRSALQRSQRDAFALGFFEDVQVDYEPPAGPDTTGIDLMFRVKEKQTGTASAGLGYSSDAGLTGFVELGHNNLFGNGQSVTLKLERGSRRSNYEVGFNEPWFMNTPTSLGVDLYKTDRSLDLYDERRTGGSVSVGRPIPWLDYTRGFATYGLEDVKLTNFETKDIEALFVTGTRRTSSVRLGLIRNSTDNPFYPASGSRVTTSSEFAGAVLGGDTDFQKHVVDQRYYIRPFWKPALMLRMRTGILTGYHAGGSVPSYETFRLGGTTTDYLRGYDDYYVVPDENVRTSDGRIVRYPGGRYMLTLTAEYQFLIAEPVHGLFFFDAGRSWNSVHDVDLTGLKRGAGAGIRLEVPLLGQIGFDYAYGFDRDGGRSGWRPHLIFGRMF
jgi:outer membrane protein insertion porin family